MAPSNKRACLNELIEFATTIVQTRAQQLPILAIQAKDSNRLFAIVTEEKRFALKRQQDSEPVPRTNLRNRRHTKFGFARIIDQIVVDFSQRRSFLVNFFEGRLEHCEITADVTDFGELQKVNRNPRDLSKSRRYRNVQRLFSIP
jgi:hypothetical protein